MSKKYLVKTEAEIAALAALFDGGKTPLPSLGGKSLRDLYGANNVYNKGYFYTLENLEDHLINDPEHADYGKYFFLVYSEDIEEHAPSEVANLIDSFDPTWRVEE